MLDILAYPFMQRAIAGGIILGVLLAFLGVFMILRRMSFFGDGIAHASLAGIAIGILANTNPLITAIIFAAVIAVIISVLETKSKLSSDAIIGVMFTTSMAFGVILMSFNSGYQPELVSFLFGNILAIKTSELVIMLVLAAIITFFLCRNYKKLALLAFDAESAQLKGINVQLYHILFSIALAVSVVLGVKILGIVLVSALLIIPSSCAKLFSKSFKTLIIGSIVVSEITILLGLLTSYILDLPSGAVIVVSGFGIFLLALLGKQVAFKK